MLLQLELDLGRDLEGEALRFGLVDNVVRSTLCRRIRMMSFIVSGACSASAAFPLAAALPPRGGGFSSCPQAGCTAKNTAIANNALHALLV